MSMLDILITILFSSCFLQVYCEEKCPEGQIYDPSVSINVTCSHLYVSNGKISLSTVRTEGCRCKDNNKYINQTGQCVSKNDCLKCVENDGENLALKDINRCPRKNEEYVKCSNICPEKTCYSYRFKRICFSLRCGAPKCQCRKGYIRSEDQNSDCVKIRDCRNKRKKSKM